MMKPSQFAVELGIIWNRFAPELTFGVFINKFEKYLLTLDVNPLKISNGAYLNLLKIFYEARHGLSRRVCKVFLNRKRGFNYEENNHSGNSRQKKNECGGASNVYAL